MTRESRVNASFKLKSLWIPRDRMKEAFCVFLRLSLHPSGLSIMPMHRGITVTTIVTLMAGKLRAQHTGAWRELSVATVVGR